jgi:hypothetical protein
MQAAIDNLATPGFLPDAPDLIAPAGAWTDSRNVRYRDGAAEKCRGYEQALGELSVTSIWAAPIQDGVNSFWAYGSGSVMYATDGSTHANITGTITLGATDDLGYTGGHFHGHLLVNDGTNIPQSWNPSLSNDLVSLTAWPAVTLTCKVLRPFKDFIFALRITDTGAYNPRLLRWSDRAAQNALPLSWDFADPTNQAGINELGQTADTLIDLLPLRDSAMIYKELNTWVADYAGGDDIFTFRQVFSQVGMLTENCALVFGSQHLVMTDQDVVVHDGNSATSILDRRARRWLFSRINTSRFKRCFLVPDYRNREAYICFPESGQDWPTMALVWNWAENTLHPFELGGPKTWGAHGIVQGTAVTFDSDTGTFDDGGAGTFDDETYSPFQSRILLLDATAKKAYQNDTGETYNGTAMTAYATRTGLSVTKDLGGIKRVRRLLPRVIGDAGGILRFYIGARQTQNATTSWTGPYNFTIGTDYKIDVRVSARLLDLRVEFSGTGSFRFHGVTFDFENDGLR